MWNEGKVIVTKAALRTVFVLILSTLLSCKDDGVEVVEPLGDYIFVERTVITDATLLRGDPSWVLIQVVEPSMFYTFDPASRTLSCRGVRLPINADLKLIFADEYYQLLPHVLSERTLMRQQDHFLSNENTDTSLYITIGAHFWLTPVYFTPHYIDPSVAVDAIGDNGLVAITMSGVSPQIVLRPDSVFVKVTNRVDSVMQFGGGSGNWAVFEFKDSLTIKNYGFQPKQNVTLNPMGIGKER
jgi:hypothetical protein